jgi:hypothetical protein
MRAASAGVAVGRVPEPYRGVPYHHALGFDFLDLFPTAPQTFLKVSPSPRLRARQTPGKSGAHGYDLFGVCRGVVFVRERDVIGATLAGERDDGDGQRPFLTWRPPFGLKPLGSRYETLKLYAPKTRSFNRLFRRWSPLPPKLARFSEPRKTAPPSDEKRYNTIHPSYQLKNHSTTSMVPPSPVPVAFEEEAVCRSKDDAGL